MLVLYVHCKFKHYEIVTAVEINVSNVSKIFQIIYDLPSYIYTIQLFFQFQLYDGKIPISLVSQTKYTEMITRWNWNEWLTFSCLVSDLPKQAKLVFTVWDSKSPGEMFCVGTASINVFDDYGEMNRGIKDLRIIEDISKEDSSDIKKIVYRLKGLSNVQDQYDQGQMIRNDWMDRLAFREISELTEKLKRDSGSLFLTIQFPTFKQNTEAISVLHYDQGISVPFRYPNYPKYCKQYDPSAGKENIVEKKHLALARSLRSGLDDRDLRPNAEIKKKLSEIMEYPPTTVLSGPELDLVWKHRKYLSRYKAGLTKFVKCINWDNEDQKKVGEEFLNKWALLDAENALELLGPGFTVPEVRQYAVKRLRESSDGDLMLYLLQLVQALK